MWAEGVRVAEVTQSEMTYVGGRQANVEQWVALRSLFEVCEGGKGYEGVGRRTDAWWRQEAMEKQLRKTLAGISREAKRRRREGDNSMGW